MTDNNRENREAKFVDYLSTFGLIPLGFVVLWKTGWLKTAGSALGLAKNEAERLFSHMEDYFIRQAWRLKYLYSITALISAGVGLSAGFLGGFVLPSILLGLVSLGFSLVFALRASHLGGLRPVPRLDGENRQVLDDDGNVVYDYDPVTDPNRSISLIGAILAVGVFPVLLGISMILIGNLTSAPMWIAHAAALPIAWGLFWLSVVGYSVGQFVRKGVGFLERALGVALGTVESLGVNSRLGDRKKLEAIEEEFLASLLVAVVYAVATLSVELYTFSLLSFIPSVFATVAFMLVLNVLVDYRLSRAKMSSAVQEKRRRWASLLDRKLNSAWFIAILFAKLTFGEQFEKLVLALNSFAIGLLEGLVSFIGSLSDQGACALIRQGNPFAQAFSALLFLLIMLIFIFLGSRLKKASGPFLKGQLATTVYLLGGLAMIGTLYMGSSSYVNAFIPSTCSLPMIQTGSTDSSDEKAETAKNQEKSKDVFAEAETETSPADENASADDGFVEVDDSNIVDLTNRPKPDKLARTSRRETNAGAEKPARTAEVARAAQAARPSRATARATASIGGCDADLCPQELQGLLQKYGGQ